MNKVSTIIGEANQARRRVESLGADAYRPAARTPREVCLHVRPPLHGDRGVAPAEPPANAGRNYKLNFDAGCRAASGPNLFFRASSRASREKRISPCYYFLVASKRRAARAGWLAVGCRCAARWIFSTIIFASHSRRFCREYLFGGFTFRFHNFQELML